MSVNSNSDNSLNSLKTNTRTVVEVAVGVLINSTGALLLGQRPDGKPYAGYWEFPGGKIEAGETLFEALKRELLEEINVVIDDAQEIMVIEHDYPHAYVRLHICVVKSWQGQARGLENQSLAWLERDDIDRIEVTQFNPILPATVPILERLKNL